MLMGNKNIAIQVAIKSTILIYTTLDVNMPAVKEITSWIATLINQTIKEKASNQKNWGNLTILIDFFITSRGFNSGSNVKIGTNKLIFIEKITSTINATIKDKTANKLPMIVFCETK